MSDACTPNVEEFLRQFEVADEKAAAAEPEVENVRQWMHSHPRAALDLVRSARATRADLQAVRQRLVQVERAQRMGVPQQPTAAELRRQSQAWDKVLGTGTSRGESAGPVGAGRSARRQASLEDAGLRFISAHGGKLWLAVLITAMVLVFQR